MNPPQNQSGGSSAFTPVNDSSNSRVAITSLPNILQQAVVLGASDIHFTPTAGEVLLRYRIGVELRDMGVLTKSQFMTIDRNARQYAGISILSNQQVEGKFELEVGAKKVHVGVQIMPTEAGDNLLLQLKTEGEITSPLTRLGMSHDEQAIVEDFLSRDHGMLVVIGPAKSGKTTTLYSILSDIDTKQTPITTLELDIKSKLVGVTQNKVNADKGNSIAEGLKVLLEQGKHFIMLGQITDGATAIAAMDASTSDHQIVAGMYTDSIGETINYMSGFKIQPFEIASNLLVIVNQRLLRLLCPFCKQPYTPDPKEIAFLRQNFDLETAVMKSPQVEAFKTYDQVPPPEPTPQAIAQLAPTPAPADEPAPPYPSATPQPSPDPHSHSLDHKVIPAPPASSLVGHSILERISSDPSFLNRGLDVPTPPPAPQPVPVPAPAPQAPVTPAETAVPAPQPEQNTDAKMPPINYIINHLKLFKSVGCEHCQGTGYQGIGAIFEVMQMNEKIGEVVLAGGNSFKIQQAAEANGLVSLRMSAINKILVGDTSVEEVSRILALLSQGVGILT